MPSKSGTRRGRRCVRSDNSYLIPVVRLLRFSLSLKPHNHPCSAFPGQPRSQAFFNRANDLSRMLVTVGSLLRPLNSDFGLAPGEVIRYVGERFTLHLHERRIESILHLSTSLANPDLVVAHIHLYSATLALCNLQRNDDPMMNDRAVKAAVAIANVGKHLRSGGRLELIHSNLMIMVRR